MITSSTLLAEMKRLHPLSIDLSLDRIRRLLAKLGDPHLALPPTVHIAGTNGKGSTTAYLRAILQAAGYTTHVYTSPHLVRFHERIVLADPRQAGDPARNPASSSAISEHGLVDVLSRVLAANAGDQITFFEITTAAAFLAFSQTPADALILEVGLGGRLDTTNVVESPALCVITPVSLDHRDRLGDTIAQIAGEKAGIIKRRVPVVVSRQETDASVVIEATARRLGAPLIACGVDFDVFEQNGRLVLQGEERLLDLPKPSLLGPHQLLNAGTAAMAAIELSRVVPALDIDETAIARGLTRAVWPARMQQLSSGPLADIAGPAVELWLDGGHNPGAGIALAETLAELDERSPKPVDLLVGMLQTKDARGFLTPFQGLARSLIAVPVPQSPDGSRTPEDLRDLAEELGFLATSAPSVLAALSGMGLRGGGPRRVLICGSLYLAGNVLAFQEGVVQQAI